MDIQGSEKSAWQLTTGRAIKSVVSIHFCQTSCFDTEGASPSEATGFIVDAEKGLILTNRHVVGSGPFWGYCVFENHEECDVYAVYRDPIHDFGILRFDPKAIKYMPLVALELRPDMACVGVEIRVVGNDAGEKLSILSGVISRMDRNAPIYGDRYNDFNTNYIQAAASASGGSSGSPVINIDGFAVALQAGGITGAATDYFLPLDRSLRALGCIQRAEQVSRGTIQCQWILKPFDLCRRLGLTPDWEAAIREKFPKETGMLVARVVLPRGPAHLQIEQGDVLIKVNGTFLTQFIPLDEILDSSVGRRVKLLVQRGGKDREVEIEVGDLHSITPDRFVSVAGGVFHNISYQQARVYAIAIQEAGVYVSYAAGSFEAEEKDGWLIEAIDNKKTPDLDSFIEVMKSIPDRARVVVSHRHLSNLHSLMTTIFDIDRHWSKDMRLAKRNDETGLWDFTTLGRALLSTPRKAQRANFTRMNSAIYPEVADLIRSFVQITATMPISLEGFTEPKKTGHGLVIDNEKGLVVVSRAIVPHDLCDILITVAQSIVVDGRVIFLHPLQNYAIVQYDPSLVQAPVKSARLSTKHINQGEKVIFFGLSTSSVPLLVQTVIKDVLTLNMTGTASKPRYRAINVDAVNIMDMNVASMCNCGVLAEEDGTVRALWFHYLGVSPSDKVDYEYHLGLATPMVLPSLEQIQKGVQPKLSILNVDMDTIGMSEARVLGLGEEWIERVEKANSERHQLFQIRKVDSDHTGGLEEKDVLLTLNDKIITNVADLDVQYNHDVLRAVVVRERHLKAIEVRTVPTENFQTDRVIVFCGLILHRPHHAVRQQIRKVHSAVYVAERIYGSPACAYYVGPTNFITHVNDVPTPDLDSFVAETTTIPDNTYFRLKGITFSDVPWVATMKKNNHYFPTFEFVRDKNEDRGWRKEKLDSVSCPLGDSINSFAEASSSKQAEPGESSVEEPSLRSAAHTWKKSIALPHYSLYNALQADVTTPRNKANAVCRAL